MCRRTFSDKTAKEVLLAMRDRARQFGYPDATGAVIVLLPERSISIRTVQLCKNPNGSVKKMADRVSAVTLNWNDDLHPRCYENNWIELADKNILIALCCCSNVLDSVASNIERAGIEAIE